MSRYWIPLDARLPKELVRLMFYSCETEFVHVGILRNGHWYDEEVCDPLGRACEVTGVTHWRSMPRRPRMAHRADADTS